MMEESVIYFRADFVREAMTGSTIFISVNHQDIYQYYDSNSDASSPGLSRSNSDEYKWIENTLKQCDKDQWELYLEQFKKHKITDDRILYLKDEEDWEEILPEIGIRILFKEFHKEKFSNSQ